MLLIAACLAVVSPPQSGDVVQLLVHPRQTYTQQGTSWQIDDVGTPIVGVGGGWCVGAFTYPAVGIMNPGVVLGQLPGAPIGAAELLRVPQTINGVVQGSIWPLAMRDGEILYSAIDDFPATTSRTLWLEDQLLVQTGDPVQLPNTTWFDASDAHFGPNGTILVDSRIRTNGLLRRALVEWPSLEVLLMDGDVLPGINAPGAIEGSFSFSDDGTHWAVAFDFYWPGAGFQSGSIVVDGAVHDFGGGFLAVAGQPVPPSMGGLPHTDLWRGFAGPVINDAGDLAFASHGDDATGPGAWQHTVRNGVAVQGPALYTVHGPLGLDPSGALLTWHVIHGVPLMENELVFDTHPGIDADLDGLADPGYTTQFSFLPRYSTTNSQHLTLFRSVFAAPGGISGFGIGRGRNYRLDAPHCTGVPNSTGRAGGLVVTGDRRASANEIVLQAFGMPQNASGFFLMSQTPGFTPQPGGSQGNLCLDMPIGRLDAQVFFTSTTGQGRATVDTTAIPGPTGTVTAMAGQTWYCQAWHRDAVGGTATSNFTNAVSVRFE